MAIKSREDILNSIRAFMPDDTADDAIALIEDVTDTLTDYENKVNNNGENWEQKYRDNDAAWRKKYRDRFFGAPPAPEDDPPADEGRKPLTYENLFKEG